MIVAVHSYKGGTGKTLISANLAALLASQGKKTCLLDMDFRAPSLNSFFRNDHSEYWLNDYLNGDCRCEEILHDCCCEVLDKDKLLVGMANPSTKAIIEMASKDRKWEMQALTRLFLLKDTLFNSMGFHDIVLDTSPGLSYASVNAILAADIVLMVTTLDQSDIEGVSAMLRYLYGQIGKKTAVVINKVPADLLQSQRMDKLYENWRFLNLAFYESIACYCDVPISKRPFLFVCREQLHPFSSAIERLESRIAACQRC